ncbi:MAG: glycosyltransferase family 4 protein [Saprospiraceae bacterium]
MNKKKILLWAPFGSGKHYWGPGISAYNLYQQLDKSIYELHLAHGYKSQKDYTLFDSHTYIAKCGNSLFRQLVFLIYAKYWLKINACKYDIMHSLSPMSIGFYPAIWFEKYGPGKAYVKVTAKNSGFSGNSRLSKWFKLDKNRIKNISNISGIIAISTEIVTELQNLGISKKSINFIPNGVNTKVYSPVNKKSKTQLRKILNIQDYFTVIFTGGISDRKSPSTVLKAVTKLIEIKKEINLLIIGPERDNGDELKIINSILNKDPNLLNRVHIIGHINNIEQYYKIADIFVLPSTNEGMSNSY